MQDFISKEEHQSQVASLQHEIYQLNRHIKQQEHNLSMSKLPDPKNPFGNPTDYPEYSGDYRDVVPQMDIPGCELPVTPGKSEGSKLKQYYSTAGLCVIFQVLSANLIVLLLSALIMFILRSKNPSASHDSVYSYMVGTSIFTALNAIVLMSCNLFFAWFGIKKSKVGTSSLKNTRWFSFGKAVQYCFIGIGIQFGAAVFANLCSNIFEKFNIDTNADIPGMGETGLGFIILLLYQCIVAPVTEEIFYRGMLLKVCAKANQRFAIFISAFIFGLVHGNIPQFFLAFLLGIFLAHIDIKHNSILPSVIVHIFINTTASILNYMLENCSDKVITVSNLIYIVCSVFGLMLLLSFRKKNLIPRTTPHQSRRGFELARTSVFFSLSIILIIGLMVLNIVTSKIA